jgi:nucleotide-binding universal stress UspA family protein
MHRYLTATAYASGGSPVSSIADQAPSTTPAALPLDQQGSESQPATGDLVVVGLDGTGCARHAAGWAAAEAAHQHADLRLIFAYHLPPAGSSGYNPYPPHLLADLREDGAAVLGDTAAALQRQYPYLKVSTTLSYGDPATVLRHASGTAKLTVVGTHGGNRMTVALGSVAASVAATSPSPVAVVHLGSANRNGPVVVGVDGSANSRAALTYAFQAAADRNATLVAVHCWTDPSIDGPVPA